MDAVIARQVAAIILEGFANYRSQFTEITLGARHRFLKADWCRVQQATSDRFHLYDNAILNVVSRLAESLSVELQQTELWVSVRNAYINLISFRSDPELAETFYNSVYRKVFTHGPEYNDLLFMHSEFDGFSVHSPKGIYRSYQLSQGLVKLVGQVLDDVAFELPWAYRRRDVRNIITGLYQALSDRSVATIESVDVLKWVFYRNKAAYLVGRILYCDGVQPFVLPVLNNEKGGLYVDTLLCDNDDVSILFSFTRSYFMVDARYPSECIEFLYTLLPFKSRWEMYSSIGFYKHGKTVFIRELLAHLGQSSDQFVVAPGIRGMVMSVFTLPSMDSVFKVIKDQFAPSKTMTKAYVKSRYDLVKNHDRVGRMADTQEFSNLTFPRHRFSNALLKELLEVAPDAIEVEDEKIVIRHLYIERRMNPLNLYVAKASKKQLKSVLDEYGNAIKQLAAANIFPGDMLLKNFGVTRHGRVVFYDYDEITYLTECNFRKIPEPLYPEQELAAEPWYAISDNDIFPEEFAVFLFPDLTIRQMFIEMHGELFTASYWQSVQKKNPKRQGC